LSVIGVLVMAVMLRAVAQDTLPDIAAGTPAFAGVIPGGLLIYDGSAARAVNTASQVISDVMWSPDGQWVAYRAAGGPQGAAVYAVDVTGDPFVPVMVTQTVSAALPVAFSSADRIIFGVDAPLDPIGQDANGSPTVTLTLMEAGVFSDQAPVVRGMIENFRTGCGGGSPYPMDQAMSADTGLNGNNTFLAAIDSRVLHSLGCDGVGLGVTAFDSGDTLVLGNDYVRPVLSPDGSRLAALRVQPGTLEIVPQVTIIDLDDFSTLGIDIPETPDRIVWSADGGSIYFSVRILRDQPLALTPQQSEALFGGAAPQGAPGIPQYANYLFWLDIGLGVTEGIVGSVGGWGISRVFAGENVLYYTLVPDGAAWIDGLTSGQIDRTRPDSAEQERALVLPALYRVGVDVVPVPIIERINQVVLRPA
jgi:hypothetical protein